MVPLSWGGLPAGSDGLRLSAFSAAVRSAGAARFSLEAERPARLSSSEELLFFASSELSFFSSLSSSSSSSELERSPGSKLHAQNMYVYIYIYVYVYLKNLCMQNVSVYVRDNGKMCILVCSCTFTKDI